ncbi:hypothetical protein XENORESO_011611, partial [Xenotaenia resolanae]
GCSAACSLICLASLVEWRRLISYSSLGMVWLARSVLRGPDSKTVLDQSCRKLISGPVYGGAAEGRRGILVDVLHTDARKQITGVQNSENKSLVRTLRRKESKEISLITPNFRPVSKAAKTSTSCEKNCRQILFSTLSDTVSQLLCFVYGRVEFIQTLLWYLVNSHKLVWHLPLLNGL